MKHEWQVKRTVKESPDGQKRWDRAYLLVLELTQPIEPGQGQSKAEVNHARKRNGIERDGPPRLGENRRNR